MATKTKPPTPQPKLPGEQACIDRITDSPASALAWGEYAVFLAGFAGREKLAACARGMTALVQAKPNPWKFDRLANPRSHRHAAHVQTCVKRAWLVEGAWMVKATKREQEIAAARLAALDAAWNPLPGVHNPLPSQHNCVPTEQFATAPPAAVAVGVGERGYLLDTDRDDPEGDIDAVVVAEAKPAKGKAVPFRADYRYWNFLWKRLGSRPGEMFPPDLYFLGHENGGRLWWCAAGTRDAVGVLQLIQTEPKGAADDGWFLGFSKLVNPASAYRS